MRAPLVECRRLPRRRRHRPREYRGDRLSGAAGRQTCRPCLSRRCGPHAPHEPPAPPWSRPAHESQCHAATRSVSMTPVLARGARGAGDRLMVPTERMEICCDPVLSQTLLRAQGVNIAHSRRPPPEISCTARAVTCPLAFLLLAPALCASSSTVGTCEVCLAAPAPTSAVAVLAASLPMRAA